MEKTAVEQTAMEKTAVEQTVVEKTAVEQTVVEQTAVERTAVERTAVEQAVVERTPYASEGTPSTHAGNREDRISSSDFSCWLVLLLDYSHRLWRAKATLSTSGR